MSNTKDSDSKTDIFKIEKESKQLDTLETIFKETNKTNIRPKVKKKEIQIEDYQIYDFLEKEISRLEKLDQFFSVQMPLERIYNQTKGLIKKERIELESIKEKLVEDTLKTASPIHNFLDDLIRRSY